MLTLQYVSLGITLYMPQAHGERVTHFNILWKNIVIFGVTIRHSRIMPARTSLCSTILEETRTVSLEFLSPWPMDLITCWEKGRNLWRPPDMWQSLSFQTTKGLEKSIRILRRSRCFTLDTIIAIWSNWGYQSLYSNRLNYRSSDHLLNLIKVIFCLKNRGDGKGKVGRED